jgi:hypothetical protein
MQLRAEPKTEGKQEQLLSAEDLNKMQSVEAEKKKQQQAKRADLMAAFDS